MFIQISPSSGRLQLIDVTGSIDVIIPDLPSTWNINSIYKVNEFSLVMEGIPEKVDCSGLHLNESFLCRNIFCSIPLRREIKLVIYLLYHFRDIKLRNQPFHSCIKGSGNFDELQSGRFHLLLVTHKYHVQQKLLRIGGYYIIKHRDEDMLRSVEDVNDVSCVKVVITSRTHLRSLLFSFDEILPNNKLAQLSRFVDSFVSNTEELFECPHQNDLPLLRLNNQFLEIRPDICVHLSTDIARCLKEDLKVLDEVLVMPTVSLKELASISWCNGTIITGSVQSWGTSDPEFQLPQGNLISFHGHVLAVHNSGCSSFASNLRHKSPPDVHWAKFFQVTNSVCIHVLVDHHIVRVFGTLSKHAYPIGFGPGIVAAFHRILVLSERNELILTPTSFIAIKARRVISDQFSDDYNNPSVASGLCSVASLVALPSALISEIIQYADYKPMQFRCRVVAIYVLVLEKNGKSVHRHSRIHSRSPVVNIPLAGFVLDDGSSSCCCWVNSDRAATLLRLDEEISHEITGSIQGSKRIRVDEACISTVHHLDKILKKHDRVIVKNYGSMFDSSGQDLTFSAASDTVFSSSDEDLLKLVILNACFSTFWTVVGSQMDSNAMGQLEKRLVEMEMTMHPMENIWAREVYYTNPLTEARKLAQELLN